jgi:hypothetical protein
VVDRRGQLPGRITLGSTLGSTLGITLGITPGSNHFTMHWLLAWPGAGTGGKAWHGTAHLGAQHRRDRQRVAARHVVPQRGPAVHHRQFEECGAQDEIPLGIDRHPLADSSEAKLRGEAMRHM